MRIALLRGAVAAAALWMGLSGAAAQWPAKTIQLVVPFAPPGAADLLGRTVAEGLAAELKQHVVVENRGGAGGVVGSAQVARAEPDGYTLLLSGLASHVIAPLANPKSGYDPLRDFTHIAYVGGPPVGWVVTPSTDMRTVDDVLAQARAGKLAGYASPGLGTLGQLAAEQVLQKARVTLAHIPYNSAAMNDIIAGRVELGSFAWSSVLGQVQSGTVRALAVSSEARMPGFPDVPTFKELGHDLVASTWFSISGPKGLPKEIVQRLNEAVVKTMARPDVRERLLQNGIETKSMSAEQLTSHVEAEIGRWQVVMKNGAQKKD
jgi:tripartite-type tricarboxylate transporter receptor subunit TctC